MRDRRLIFAQAALWRWLNWSRARPWTALAVWMFITIIAGYVAVTRLGVDTDTNLMISAQEDFRRDQLVVEATFPALDRQILVLARADSADAADIFARALVDRLNAQPERFEGVFAPSADAYFERNGLLYLETGELEQLLSRLNEAAPLIARLGREPALADLFAALEEGVSRAEDGADLARVEDAVARTIEARLASQPEALSWRALFEDDADADALHQRLISITPVLDYSRMSFAREAADAIEAAVAGAREETGVDAQTFVTGDPVLRNDELESVTRGIWTALAISIVAIAALLLYALRSAVLAVATVGSILLSIVITAAFAAVTIGDLNLVSVAFAVLMLGLGVDFAIHLALHLVTDRRRGVATRSALYRSVRHIGLAFAIAAPTTAFAFLSFSPTRFIGMAQLGVIASGGVAIAFVVSTSIIAATAALTGRDGAALASDRQPRSAPRKSGWAGLRRIAAWLVLALGLGALFAAPFARFDADPMSLRDPHAASVRAFDRLFDEEETHPYRLSAIAPDIEAAHELAERVAELPETGRVLTLAHFLPEDADVKRELIDFASYSLASALSGGRTDGGAAEDEEGAEPPAPRSAALAQLQATLASADEISALRLNAALSELRLRANTEPGLFDAVRDDVFAYWPSLFDRLQAQIAPGETSVETLPAPIRDRFLAPDGRVRVEIAPAGDARDADLRRAFVDSVLTVAPHAAGAARSVMASGDVVVNAMKQAVVVALIGVFIFVLLVLRDFTLTTFILFPLVLAGLLTAATSLVVGMPFNFANVIVIPLLIGIGVDSGVHLALRLDANESAHAVYDTSTPRATLFSALTTIASFSSLMASPHRGTASMGGLLSIALLWTTVCTVVVLPTIVEALQTRRARAAR